jgi:hypothetical protein
MSEPELLVYCTLGLALVSYVLEVFRWSRVFHALQRNGCSGTDARSSLTETTRA